MNKLLLKTLRFTLLLSSLTALAYSSAQANPAPVKESIPLPKLEFVFEAHVQIGSVVEVGKTGNGQQRYIPITGGFFQGERLNGEVLPGGADWQTERADGVLELNALYSIRCDDGTVIIVHNHGIVADGGQYIKTTPVFTAPEGKYSWLNTRKFVGTVSGSDAPNTVVIRFFMIL